jgi:hypothetical protein
MPAKARKEEMNFVRALRGPRAFVTARMARSAARAPQAEKTKSLTPEKSG